MGVTGMNQAISTEILAAAYPYKYAAKEVNWGARKPGRMVYSWIPGLPDLRSRHKTAHAAVRVSTFNFLKQVRTCCSTVRTLRSKIVAISESRFPSAIH